MSKGEDRIVDLLNLARIKYVREKSFSDLKHGLFRYDFYIPDLDGGRAIIEFNGQQHYYFVGKFYKNTQEWRKMQEHDRRKISYALANDIKIYIIPYWEISKIATARQLFQEKYLAKTRWKNDEDFEEYTKHQKT